MDSPIINFSADSTALDQSTALLAKFEAMNCNNELRNPQYVNAINNFSSIGSIATDFLSFKEDISERL